MLLASRFHRSVNALCLSYSNALLYPISVAASPTSINKRNFAVTGRKSKNVADKKNKNDAKTSKLYSRLGIRILMAVRAGGSDPSTNIELARALKEANTAKLPKDNIERAISRGTGANNEDSNYKNGVYEIFGMGGVGILCTTLTNSITRANQTIKLATKNADCKMASTGSIVFRFLHKGVCELDKPYKSDDIIELALNNDVEEVQFYDVATQTLLSDIDDNHHNNTTAPPLIVVPSDQLYIMIDALHTAGYTNATGKFSYLPKDLISNSNLTDAEKQVNTELIEELEALEDVDEVFHDMQEQQ